MPKPFVWTSSESEALLFACVIINLLNSFTWADPEGDRGPLGPPGNSQVAICFLRNICTDPFEKQLDPSVPIAFRNLTLRFHCLSGPL